MFGASGITHTEEALPRGTVLIAGGGPVGLLLATVLAHYGIKSVLLERNQTTTKWPKMDLTNARSMEILRRLGLADAWRSYGVPSHIPAPVLVSSGLNSKEAITQWPHPSVDEFQSRIKERNDGSQPLEAWQRGSQVLFEQWLKNLCDKSGLVDLRFGWKIESVEETEGQVRTLASQVDTGNTVNITSGYVAGCDGASSKVRSSLYLPVDGGPIPSCVLLVHFKSRDMTRLHKQGRFWHIFFLLEPGEFGGAIIAQDEIDTWTVHLFQPLDTDMDKIDSKDAIYTVLGGLGGKYAIKIDEILVRSTWRPNIAVTRSWTGNYGRVFLAGDAAHQSIPTGGYGMNMGIGDAYDLGWKLAAVINGYAGKELLNSYEVERRPVALRNVEHSGVHMNVHFAVKDFLLGGDPRRIDNESEDAKMIRRKIHEHYQAHPGENTDLGIEMGYRYNSGVIFKDRDETSEPEWKASEYIPTTWPGSRPPHIFLSDGSAIFDNFGKDWTLVNFAAGDNGSKYITEAAKSLSLPLKHFQIPGEKHARKLWERDLVLIRPDEHVAWRSNNVLSLAEAKYMLQYVTGLISAAVETESNNLAHVPVEAFSSTVELTTQIGEFNLEKLGDFQE